MTRTDSRAGMAALTVAHCAGMLDVVSLPVWVGTLVSRYGFDAQRAGALVTLFLAGVVLASVVLAPRFQRLSGRRVAGLGFAISALGFAVATTRTDFLALAVIQALCGVATGAALSVTHGTIGRSARPHRLFATVNAMLGIAAVFYLGIVPQIIASFGAQALFTVFASAMALAAVVSLAAFPTADPAPPAPGRNTPTTRFIPAVWFGLSGLLMLAAGSVMSSAGGRPSGSLASIRPPKCPISISASLTR